jgi:hypothetical protein
MLMSRHGMTDRTLSALFPLPYRTAELKIILLTRFCRPVVFDLTRMNEVGTNADTPKAHIIVMMLPTRTFYRTVQPHRLPHYPSDD